MGEEQNHLFGLKKMGEDKKSESLKKGSLMGEFCTVGFKRYDFLDEIRQGRLWYFEDPVRNLWNDPF